MFICLNNFKVGYLGLSNPQLFDPHLVIDLKELSKIGYCGH